MRQYVEKMRGCSNDEEENFSRERNGVHGSVKLASVKAASLFRAQFSILRRQTRVPLAKPITQWLVKEVRANFG